MNISGLLTELRDRDIRVWADGDILRCNAPSGALSPELRDQLRECKHDILEFLRSAESLSQQQRAIVPLQAHGNRIPVYAVAGHNGDVFCYRALAKHLGNEQPFYGLQPPGLDGHSEPLVRVEDLAAYFAEQIRGFQSQGPCVIAGYCAGGTIAFELSKRLLQLGVTVSFLAQFGSPYATWFRRLPQLRELLSGEIKRTGKHVGALAARSWKERRLYFIEKLRQREAERDAARVTEVDPVLIRRTKVESVTLGAIRHYIPDLFVDRIALFLPNREWANSGSAPLSWQTKARHSDVYVGPDTCETDVMLREPFVPVFAEIFRQYLDLHGAATVGAPLSTKLNSERLR